MSRRQIHFMFHVLRQDAGQEGNSEEHRTYSEDLIKGLLFVSRCIWWGAGILKSLTIIGGLLILRVGVRVVWIICCLRRILHGWRRGISRVVLVVRNRIVV